MNTYISRQPVLNRKQLLGGYKLILDPAQAKKMLEAARDESGRHLDGFTDTLADLSDQTMHFIDWFEALSGKGLHVLSFREDKPGTVVEIRRNAAVTADQCKALKEKGFRLAVDSSFYQAGELGVVSPIFTLADFVTVDFPTVSLAKQKEMIRKTKHRVMFIADRIETWEDWRVARDMDYSLFRGYYFMWPEPGSAAKDIKSLDACLISILAELDSPEPSFKKISELIEHDLGLSYRLLRLVNSAYMAPKHKINSITHALTYLGTRELHQWISMLLMGGIKSAKNSELVKMSLVRGKFMTLIAEALELPGLGAESFFTGLFSLIDVIFNKDMRELLTGLPLTDNVRNALQGETGELSRLLAFVVDYEQARWASLDGRYPLDRLGEEQLVSLYLQAHQWSKMLE